MSTSQDPASPQQPDEPPRIIVDTDWKQQAQAEKEKLAQKEQAQAASSSPDDADGGSGPADFRALLGSLVTQAMLYLGGMPDPQTGRAIVALDYAQHAIDLLQVLEDKTKGNLSEEESQELTGVLHELRMRFVQIAKTLASQPQAGEPGPASAPPIG